MCRFENAIMIAKRRTDAIDMRLQRAPALEAIVMGDRQLGLMQLGIGLAGAQLNEPLLGGLLEPIEIGIRGQSLRRAQREIAARRKINDWSAW